MTVSYFCVEDCIANQYGPVFPARNPEVAKRMFKKLLLDVGIEYYSDYTLHHVFDFDDELGNVSITDNTIGSDIVCNGSVFLEENK